MTKALPLVCKEVIPFENVILFVVVAPLFVTACKLPVVALALIFDKPPPSPTNTAGDDKLILRDAVFPFSKASWSVDAPPPLYFCTLRPVLQPAILTNTNDYFHGKMRHFPLLKTLGSSGFCFGILNPPCRYTLRRLLYMA